MIKVLIVDDDKLARKGIISIMPWDKYNMKIIGDVQNGRVALEFLQKHQADIMFVDIDMPELGGIELMEECRKKFPEVQFVVLTFYEEWGFRLYFESPDGKRRYGFHIKAGSSQL